MKAGFPLNNAAHHPYQVMRSYMTAMLLTPAGVVTLPVSSTSSKLLGYSIDDVIERAMVDEDYNHKLLYILKKNQDIKEHRA